MIRLDQRLTALKARIALSHEDLRTIGQDYGALIALIVLILFNLIFTTTIQFGYCHHRSAGSCNADPHPWRRHDTGDCNWRHRYFSRFDHGSDGNTDVPDFQRKTVWHP